MEQYLIAHKCYGQPAFEVAERQECAVCRGVGCHECKEEGYWWITHYGHRAFPYWWVEISALLVNQTPNLKLAVVELANGMPADLPEHFEVSAAPKGKGIGLDGRTILEKIGLVKPLERMRRL